MLTIPLITWAHTIPSTSQYFRVQYNDLSTQNVTLNAGTYFLDGSSSGGLLAHLKTRFDANATNGGTWTFAFDSNFKVSITKTGGAKTVIGITALQPTRLSWEDLGYNSAGTNVINNSGLAAAAWRPARAWSPDTYLDAARTNIDPVVITQRSRYSGRVLAQKRSQSGGIKDLTYTSELVAGALLWGFASDDSALSAGVSWLTKGDPNASLDRFFERYWQGVSGNLLPRARVAHNRSAPNTYDDVQLFHDQLTSPDIIAETSAQPLLGTATIHAVPYVL